MDKIHKVLIMDGKEKVVKKYSFESDVSKTTIIRYSNERLKQHILKTVLNGHEPVQINSWINYGKYRRFRYWVTEVLH